MNKNIVDYYQKLRENDDLRGAYVDCENMDQVMDVAVEEAGKLGFFFTKEEAQTVGFDIEALHRAATNDDELSDFELELVAAGLPINTSSGVTRMS